jgi:hypothetical protein
MNRALLCSLLLSAPAFAAAKTKVLIDGPKAVAAEVTKAVKAKHGTGTVSLPDEPTAGDVKNACLEHGAVAIITARQAGSVMNFMVLNCYDGGPITTFKMPWGKKPPKALPKGDVTAMMKAITEGKPAKKEKAAPPPPAEEKPNQTEQKPAEEVPAQAPAEGRRKERPAPSEPPPPPAQQPEAETKREEPEETSERPMGLRVGVGFKEFARQFGYTDDIFNRLSTYKLPLGPALALDAEAYPAAFFARGPLANIGLMAYFDYAVGISSKAADGTKYGTQALNLKFSLTYRLPIGPLQINPFVGYTDQTYGITSNTGVKPNIPSVAYGGLRGGLQIRAIIFGPVFAQIAFAGQYVLSSGEISTYFPHLKVGGLDSQFAVGVSLFKRLEVKLQGDYTRFWYSMNPVPGDANVAGGALDIYGSGMAVASFTL